MFTLATPFISKEMPLVMLSDRLNGIYWGNMTPPDMAGQKYENESD